MTIPHTLREMEDRAYLDSVVNGTQAAMRNQEPDLTKPPCVECGATTPEEAETMCRCAGDKDDCHGCHLWPDV